MALVEVFTQRLKLVSKTPHFISLQIADQAKYQSGCKIPERTFISQGKLLYSTLAKF
jgi:hypothetical protein